MKKLILLLMLCTTLSAQALHASITNKLPSQTLQANCCCCNNGSSVAGALLVGTFLGVLLSNCVDSCNCRPCYHHDYYYEDCYEVCYYDDVYYPDYYHTYYR